MKPSGRCKFSHSQELSISHLRTRINRALLATVAKVCGPAVRLSRKVRNVSQEFDYDLVIIGAGVGGHGAALHAVASGLKTAIIESGVMGGTCVNRGCIPSKALLAASGRVRELRNAEHLKALGVHLGDVAFDRETIASHAGNLVEKLRDDLTKSLKQLKVETIVGWGKVAGPQKVEVKTDDGTRTISAKDIILAPGSVPFVPRGIELDGKNGFHQ